MLFILFVKQNTDDEVRNKDLSSDVCSSDLDKSFHHLGIPREWPAGGPRGMLEQVLAEDVRTALRRCASERATRRGCADSPGRPGGGRPGCAAAGDQLLVSCGPVKRSIWACCRASASSASEAARSEIWATRPSSSSLSVSRTWASGAEAISPRYQCVSWPSITGSSPRFERLGSDGEWVEIERK